MAKKKNNKRLIIAIIAIIVVITIVVVVVTNKKKNEPLTDEQIAELNMKKKEEDNKKALKELYEKSESQRMEYYCKTFFTLIDNDKYEDAYNLLYSEYKENYFPTLANFKKYFEDYYPESIGLSYENIERLGEIYVLTVNVKDMVNGTLGHNFKIYFVIKENALNDYVVSFSRDSAVKEESDGN